MLNSRLCRLAAVFACEAALAPRILMPVSTAHGEGPRFGGTLVISQRSEPKTLNPLIAIDTDSRRIINLITADLIHINRATQQAEPALADSWQVADGGRQFIVHLRAGLRFSDGQACDADDVVFTFASYLDTRVHSPQRDMLVIAGKPIAVEKRDQHTIVFTLAQPYAAAERIFDGLAILPRHLLAAPASRGGLASAWSLQTPPGEIAGLGPFRLKEYVPGQRLMLERNPYYWKKDGAGHALPYLDGIVSTFAANGSAEAMQFEAGETDLVSGLDPSDFVTLEKVEAQRHFRLEDLGPGLEYDLLFFNENLLPAGVAASGIAREQAWFRQVAFRKAVSEAIDRQAIVRLAFLGRAYPLSTPVTPGDKLWVDRSIPEPHQSLEAARERLKQAGFSRAPDGSLHDQSGAPVRFSITINAGKPQQSQMATIIQQDLKQLGMRVDIEPLEFRTFLDRIFNSFNYEAAIIALVEGDSDPNSELGVFSSSGGTHVWSLRPFEPLPAWQAEIDRLMQRQMVTLNYSQRKSIYDRVQQLLWENVPVICLISPHILVGAKDRVGNFRPAILSDYTLWNADTLFMRP